jgi:3-dehydroquinate synthase
VSTTVLHCRPPHEPTSTITIARGVLSRLPELVGARRPFVCVDPHAPLPPLPPGWPRFVAGGEADKTLAGCERLLRAMAQAGVDRGSLLVAIGGGAVGDLAGLAASLYMRGIELWQAPTTLLAMVDSSVGGKTAVNLPEGKNLVGTVHPAREVLIDLDTTTGLPEVEYRSGLAEVVKAAIGLDAELFARLEAERDAVRGRDAAVLHDVVVRAVAAKIAVVEQDPREHGRRRLLNLGHTLGHALEAHAGGRRPHGLCVARGLHFAVDLAAALGVLAGADHERCRALLRAYGFAPDPLPPVDALLPFLGRDKKVLDGVVHFVVPTAIGHSDVRPMARDELAGWLRRLSSS